jgi:hypothetical protein
MQIKQKGSVFVLSAMFMLPLAWTPSVQSAGYTSQNSVVTHRRCTGKGTNYQYIVPRSQTGNRNLANCNGGMFFSLKDAMANACASISTFNDATRWPQTRSNPPEFGIRIVCGR